MQTMFTERHWTALCRKINTSGYFEILSLPFVKLWQGYKTENSNYESTTKTIFWVIKKRTNFL